MGPKISIDSKAQLGRSVCRGNVAVEIASTGRVSPEGYDAVLPRAEVAVSAGVPCGWQPATPNKSQASRVRDSRLGQRATGPAWSVQLGYWVLSAAAPPQVAWVL